MGNNRKGKNGVLGNERGVRGGGKVVDTEKSQKRGIVYEMKWTENERK